MKGWAAFGIWFALCMAAMPISQHPDTALLVMDMLLTAILLLVGAMVDMYEKSKQPARRRSEGCG